MAKRKLPAGMKAAMSRKVTEAISTAFMLWLISKKPTYGYDIIQTFRSEHEFSKVGPGHIYPYLSKMAKDALVDVKEVSQGKRMKKLYSITPVGRKMLADIKKRFFHGTLRARFLQEMMR